MEGWGGSKIPSVASKHEMEGSEVPRLMFRHEGGAGGVENTLRRVEMRDGGHRSPPTRIRPVFRHGGSKIPPPCRNTRGRAQKSPDSCFDTREGQVGVKHPPSRRNTRRGHRSPPTRVSTRWRGGEGRQYPLLCRNTRWRAQNPPNLCFNTREGWGGSKGLPSRVSSEGRMVGGRKHPPSKRIALPLTADVS